MHYDKAIQGDTQVLSDMEEWLSMAISGLNQQEKSLVLLVYQQDFTPTEAASVLEITPNHARVLLHKARAYLTDQFKKHEQG